MQKKLAEARALLSKLTAEEKARLAALERKKEAEAKRKAEELARQQAAGQGARAEAPEQGRGGRGPAGTAPAPAAVRERGRPGSVGHGGDRRTAATPRRPSKALAFARAQIGKPYVWGATGPGSYDCSGLTQAAWKAAGVDAPAHHLRTR